MQQQLVGPTAGQCRAFGSSGRRPRQPRAQRVSSASCKQRCSSVASCSNSPWPAAPQRADCAATMPSSASSEAPSWRQAWCSTLLAAAMVLSTQQPAMALDAGAVQAAVSECVRGNLQREGGCLGRSILLVAQPLNRVVLLPVVMVWGRYVELDSQGKFTQSGGKPLDDFRQKYRMRRGADGRLQLRSGKGEWFQCRLDMEVRACRVAAQQPRVAAVRPAASLKASPLAPCRRCRAACCSGTAKATSTPSRPTASSRSARAQWPLSKQATRPAPAPLRATLA